MLSAGLCIVHNRHVKGLGHGCNFGHECFALILRCDVHLIVFGESQSYTSFVIVDVAIRPLFSVWLSRLVFMKKYSIVSNETGLPIFNPRNHTYSR
jgi:hypothetical protein